jgi:D-glycero-beta-D-manno-heptose-7-phosphate kinase
MDNKSIIEKFAMAGSLKLLVIGDVMLDNYVWGDVERISPEAPVPVIAKAGEEQRLGGAANVALNIKAMGAEVTLCAIAGNDSQGDRLQELLENNGIDTGNIIITKSRKTATKTRVISGSHHLLRIDDESNDDIPSNVENEMIEHILKVMDEGKVNAVVFQDYDKGLISKKMIRNVVEKAKTLNIPVLADPKEKNFNHYKGITLFKPNYKEFIKGIGKDIRKTDVDDLYQAANEFCEAQDIKYIMLTMAEQGILICSKNFFKNVPAIDKLDVADVSGAGDTVISIAAIGLALNFDLDDIAFIANLAGGLVCEKPGVVPIVKEQLLNELKKR